MSDHARKNKNLTEDPRGSGDEGEGNTEVRRYALEYLRRGLSVIPLKPRSKEPAVEWKKYQERLPTRREVRGWFSKGERNVAIITGSISGNLIVIDFDSEDAFNKFYGELDSNHPHLRDRILSTWVVETGKGVHVYLRIDCDKEEFKEIFRTKVRWAPGVDVKAEGGYVAAPPSTHPSGKQYSFRLGGLATDIARISLKEAKELLGVLRGEGSEEKAGGVERVGERVWRRLGEDQVKRVVELIEPYYIPGHRNNILYPLLGLLVKAGVDYESSRRIVELLTTNTNDEETKQRLYLVDYHYGKRAGEIGIEKLTGVSGLREALESVLRDRGVEEEEIVRIASETIAELYSILGMRRGPGVAWLERQGGFVRKWVAVGRHGIYVFKRGREGEEPVVQIVSSAVIERSREVKVLGLELKNLYIVRIDGEEISGTVEDIVSFIEKHYGLERGARYAVARLIEHGSEGEEELFYSPGPWVVNGKIVIAREPGYTPPWKRYRVWSPREDAGEDLKRRALETIKNLVLSYRDPGKPSLVLSYAAIAPIMHHIKRALNIAPHLLIHGLEGTGKSVLIELVRDLWGLWEETLPKTDFQARAALAESTLPLVVDEIGELIEGYAKGDRGSVEALEVLHRASTQEVLRVGGGHQYGGYFLAIRTVIAATNADISLVPWQLDKFILATISLREAIDVGKAVGSTPRTMDPEVRKALSAVGLELLREVEKLLPEIEGMRRLTRVEIREKLIELGYRAWRSLYEKHGLEPFPEPSEPETEVEKTSMREQYEDLLLSYVKRGIKAERGYPSIAIYDKNTAEESPEALENLGKNLAIVVRAREDGGEEVEELVCKTPFLTGFIEWAAREYGAPRIGYKRLAEMLDIRKTRRKIGGKIVENLWAKRIS